MKHLLLVEDDPSLIGGLSFALKKQGYAVTLARTLTEADALWQSAAYDLIILDVSLPDGSGFALCQRIRRISGVPVMFLTAADEETDIIMGLDLGGDDYITKPFKLAVLLSRVNALRRRSGSLDTAVLCSGGITVNLRKGEVCKNGVPLDLTASEYKLLCFLMENPSIILSPEQILGKLWDLSDSYIDTNFLTVYIRRLRTIIEDDPSQPQKIITVRRMGYKWHVAD